MSGMSLDESTNIGAAFVGDGSRQCQAFWRATYSRRRKEARNASGSLAASRWAVSRAKWAATAGLMGPHAATQRLSMGLRGDSGAGPSDGPPDGSKEGAYSR